GKKGTVTIATNMAGRGTDIKLPAEVKEAGGLAIIGTERHESRRVDRQLRGRAGRQGDPGSSVFYVSFEDTLMRNFASDKVVKLLDRMGMKDGEVIESPMVTKSIEKAQKRVEENNFGIRKHLLEYDDVMNKQRTYIYSRRRHALMGERIGIDIANMTYDVIENIVNNYNGAADYADFSLELFKVLGIESPLTEEEFRSKSKEDIIEEVHAAAVEAFDRKSQRIIDMAMPVITRVVTEDHYEGRIMVPLTDGKRVYQIIVSAKDAYDTGCRSIVKEWHQNVVLHSIDELWKEHLRQLDELRQSVRNASYEQKDPLVIYKVESFHLFEQMLNELNVKAISTLMRGQIYVPQQPAAPQPQPAPAQQPQAPEAKDEQSAPEAAPEPAPAPKPQPKVERAMPERPAAQDPNLRESKDSFPGEAAQRAAASASQGGPSKTM
ncbi:MAG: preprotein translocase subunit SecA, partial [Paramuribaculum sp.]|nr:preprotein translocase subunit SecA [Paramuribaculum sp.]